MKLIRMLALALAFGANAACELVVAGGQSVTVGDDAAFIGTSGNRMTPARPAGSVQPTGQLIVDAAQFTGGGFLAMPSTGPSPIANGAGAPGILAAGADLQLRNGARLVGGGAQAPTGNVPTYSGGPGLAAIEATVTMRAGARATGGRIQLQEGATPALAVSIVPGPGMVLSRSILAMTGGRIRAAEFPTGLVDPIPVNVNDLLANGSTVAITGGNLRGIFTSGSLVRISGGLVGRVLQVPSSTFPPLALNPALAAFLPLSGCTEIRGGQVNEIVVNGDRVLLVGSGFNRPLGDVPLNGRTPVVVTGTLANGDPLSVSITNPLPATPNSPIRVTLARPGTDSCDSVLP